VLIDSLPASYWNDVRVADNSVVDVVDDSASGQQQSIADAVGVTDTPSTSSLSESNTKGGLTCATCRLSPSSLLDVESQRAHFRGDFHRLNVRRRLLGLPPLTEDEFNDVANDSDASSISGSDTDDDDDDDCDSIGFGLSNSKKKKMTMLASVGEQNEEDDVKIQHDKAAMITSSSSSFKAIRNGRAYFVEKKQNGRCFCLWSTVLCKAKEKPTPEELKDALRDVVMPVNTNSKNDSQNKVWVVILAAGGHVAAAVFERTYAGEIPPAENDASAKRSTTSAIIEGDNNNGGRKIRGSHDDNNMPGAPRVVAHKTYHRYVVRAKAGGRQSSEDKSGKAPKSAGSTLRRYNEQMLDNEVKMLLDSWKDKLDFAERIFVHAPGGAAKAVFSSVSMKRDDPRVRTIPFATRRPTYKEVVRVATQLLTVDFVDETSFQCDDTKSDSFRRRAQAAAAKAARAEEKVRAESKRKEREAARAEAEAAVRPPPLHEAALAGDADRVSRLLDEGADPRALDQEGRLACALAISRGKRDVVTAFRKARAKHPDKFDWDACKVPVALTDELESKQDAKKRAKAEKLRAKRAAKLKAEHEAAAAAVASSSEGHRI